MTNWFITVLNMSITASYVACVVIAARVLLRKAPKIFSYALWSVVLFRLISPFSFDSGFSFMNWLGSSNRYIPLNIGNMQQPAVDVGIDSVSRIINRSLPAAAPVASANPVGILLELAAYVWLAGIVLLMVYGVVSYIKIKRRIRHAVLVKGNVFETDRISTAFVIGIVQPKIYVPVHLTSEETAFVITHELCHIRRRDHLIKPIAFLGLVLHWFNPLMWFSYALMVKDMELSCDENVIRDANLDLRKSYSTTLLSLSSKQSGLLSPLAFGESHVKSRIRNVVNFRRPSFGISAVAVIAVIILAIFLITNTIYRDVPKIYVYSETSLPAEAIIGTYGWDFGNRKVESDSPIPTEFNYTPENTIAVQTGQQLVLSNQKIKMDRNVPFTLNAISYWDADLKETTLPPNAFTIGNNDLYINAPETPGDYVFAVHLTYDRGNVFYGFKVSVTEAAPMKGLELYIWKNKEVTGTEDTYYTLLTGTNRNKAENEIYDLTKAVRSIEALNGLLSVYSAETELFIYQMNTTDFTKEEMQTIAEQIKLTNGNYSKAIGVWQN
jgi:beta-lactamase regulating signal transducer with metallopeptidase domain